MLGLGLGLQKSTKLGGFIGLLDLFPNAAAAYSLRKLRAAYSGSAVRVRKEVSLVSSETDIGFLSDGSLDTSTLLTFASDADGGDVFVVTWYDQSTNGNYATQGTGAKQPKIVSSGAVITEGTSAKPAIDFDGVGDLFQTVVDWSTGDSTTFHVVTVNDTANYQTLLGAYYNDIDPDEKQVAFGGSGWTRSTNPVSLGQNLLEYTYFNSGTEIKFFNNGSSNGSGTILGTQKINNLIGSFDINGVYGFTGKYQELIHYNSDQSANRAGIETNTNTFYSIY